MHQLEQGRSTTHPSQFSGSKNCPVRQNNAVAMETELSMLGLLLDEVMLWSKDREKLIYPTTKSYFYKKYYWDSILITR